MGLLETEEDTRRIGLHSVPGAFLVGVLVIDPRLTVIPVASVNLRVGVPARYLRVSASISVTLLVRTGSPRSRWGVEDADALAEEEALYWLAVGGWELLVVLSASRLSSSDGLMHPSIRSDIPRGGKDGRLLEGATLS